ncbi:MAG: class I SAM-dependent methyltransferase [Novosphingobium sp.]|nr:class I SAM-dependent methyltransferase [Novosphingobium sp.]
MSARIIDRVIGGAITTGVLEIVHADGSERRFGHPAPGWPDVRIRLADPKVARDIILSPRLGAAEAFMDERLLIERGDIMGLIQLIRGNAVWERRGAIGKAQPLRQALKTATASLNQLNHHRASKANVAHHYDIGNDLYRLMLDKDHMQYSCAYWPREGMNLDDAQEAKLAHIAAKLALKPGQEVLDIGCGWGGMAIYLARHTGARVTGITLSEEQLALAKERAEQAGVSDRVSFELVDYRDLPARGKRYDRIVSVGMFEHVGRPQFRHFFRACANLLSDNGVMLLHTIGRMGTPGATDAFTRKYIFPGGYIPALSETLAASEQFRLIATDIETLRMHYAFTLREWYARCMAHRGEIEAMYDPRFFRMWTFYLAGATAAFESGGMCNYQIQFARNRHALPLTRHYLATTESALLDAR